MAAAARQRSTEYAEVCGVLELERVVSCCSGERRRTELDFGSGETFDDLHRSTTHGADPKMAGVLSGGTVWLCGAKQVKAKRQEFRASAVGQETEVADTHETFGEQVPQEAAQELIER